MGCGSHVMGLIGLCAGRKKGGKEGRKKRKTESKKEGKKIR